MAKATLTQRAFTLGEVREEFLEAKDLDLRASSLKAGLNARIKATRTLASRPGTFHVREGEGCVDLIELRPAADVVVGLGLYATVLQIIDAAGAIVASFAAPWSASASVWVEPFREKTVLGCSEGLWVLTYTGGTWSFANFAFGTTAGGELAQPYWSYVKDLTMRPSDVTGAVEITMSGPFWTPAYVGQRVRYNRSEILIDGYASPTVATGTVINTLPNSYRITVEETTAFRSGDAIIGQDTGFEGLVVNVIGLDLEVLTLDFADGPDVDEEVSSPRGSSKVTAKEVIPLLESPVWDEPLISPVRGYPQAGASAAGRLTLVDFLLVPDLIAMSSTREIEDFEVGAEDDDAIVRQAGDNVPRFRHVVNAGDLLLFSDKGLYYVSIRDGGLLTPSSFNAILFDKRGCNSVRPVAMDDGVIFVEASGSAIGAAQLQGNINLKWSVRTISTFHNHLIKTPVKLCGPSLFSDSPERYLFVINTDGTMAVMSWYEDFSVETVGFLPWQTQGTFVSLSPIFGGYWALVDRKIGSVTKRFMERFSDEAQLDCASMVSQQVELDANGAPLMANGVPLIVAAPAARHLAGAVVEAFGGGFYLKDRLVAVDGTVADTSDMPAGSYCGFGFTTRIMPWPVERVDAPYAGMLKARLIQGSVSVLRTGQFKVRANKNTRTLGGYSVGDLLNVPAPDRTEVVRFLVFGVRDHPEMEFIRDTPGNFQILAITQEVSY